MGNPIRTLSEKHFSGAPLYAEFVRVEETECIHIHWRDMRILLSPEQFKVFHKTVLDAFNKWDGKLSPDEDVLLEQIEIPGVIAFEGIGSIEEQHSELIHFHYGDIRIELQPQRFLMIARLFEQAKRKYNADRMRMIPIKDINPYDPGHFATEEEWLDKEDYQQHMDGMELVKQGIIQDYKKMRPISVIIADKGKYQRIDGFKRFMAWKEIYGDDYSIPCYIEKGNVTPGCQDGEPWFLE